MKRMNITGIRRLLFGGQPAQQVMGAGSNDPLTGDKRTVEPAQTAFPSGLDGRSLGKKRLFFRQKTAALWAKNACSLGRKFLFPREETIFSSGGNNFSFPHLALRFLLVIVMILGGVLESGAQTEVSDEQGLRKEINKGGTQTIKLTSDISLSSTLTINSDVNITLDLNGKTLSYSQSQTSYGNSVDAVCLKITKGNIIIKGGGTISSTASYHKAGLGWDTGNNSFSIVVEANTVLLENVILVSNKGKGTTSVSDGRNFTFYSESQTVDAILPLGSYIKDFSAYNSQQIETNRTEILYSQYTATFNPDNDNVATSVNYTIANTSAFNYPIVSKQGYTLNGWSTSSETETVNGVPVLKDRVATGTITYTAQWTPIPYTIKYTGLEGADQTVDYDITKQFSLPQPTKKGYTFKGWQDKNGHPVSGITYDAVSSNAEGNVYTLTAVWEINTYTITYISEGETIAEDTYQINSTKNLLSLSDKDGAKFVGWKEDTETGQPITALPGDNPRNLTLEAIWSYTYKIKYSTGTSETITDNTSHKTTDEVTLSTPKVKKDGYTFSHWIDQNNEKEFRDLKIPANTYTKGVGTVTLTAVWTPVEYTLTFNSQGGSPINPETVTIETLNLSLTDERHIPHRDYYDFKGWYADAAYTGNAITFISQATAPQTLYAKWEAHTYTIAYEGNDWTKVTGGNYPTSYTVESESVTISEAKRNQDQFLYWIDTHTNSKLKNEKLPTDAPRDLSLKAVWNNHYTLSFETKDQNVTVPNIGIFASETKTLPSAERNGYNFKGWQLGEYTYQAGDSYQATANVTFEAVWEVNPYTIKFIDNGEEVVALQQTYTIESPDVTFFSPSKDYWLFDGWKDENGTIINKIPAGSTGHRVLTASWTAITYVLTYDYGYDNKKETERYTFADRGTAENLKEATRTGYKFLGWFADGATDRLTMRPVDKSVKKKEVPITITAHWELQTYPVTFYLNDGTNAALSEQTYRYSVEAGIPAAQMPGQNEAKRTGYTFTSWNTKKDGTGTTVTEVAAGTEELKYYAQWKPNEYNITYNWNGGEILSAAPKSFVYNVGVTLPKKEEMRKDHYDFAGWTREESSTNYVTQIEASQYAEEQTFYAQWSPATYTIQFNTNTETTVADLNYLYGSEVALKKSYRNGYTFGGWYFDSALTDPVGDKVTSSTIKDNSPRAITFYAKWNPIQYTITYDTYDGTIQSGQVDSYRTGEAVTLPTAVKRDGFSFAGWYADDLLTKLVTKIEVGDYGDKTFYATWSRGFSVILSQPKEGVISVKQGDQVIASGKPLAKGTELTISATPTTSGYVLKQLVINGQAFTTSPQTVTMGEANLIISAEFVASTKPIVSAPTITTDPDREKVDAETLVKVTLAKTDAASTLYYSLNTQEERPYSAPFVVDGGVGDTVTIRAIARRSGYTDGITTRKIVFDGRLHLTFDLPAGVTATAPDGGAVVDAIVKGGTFEFKLQVDKSYFASTDSLQVMANDSLIKPGSSGVYRLYDQKGDVKVVVKGLKAHTCVVTLLQTEHGQIAFAEGDEESSRTINYGTELTLQATADEDYKFSKWSTGSQQNPITIKVVSDTTISATFVNDYKAYQITLPEVEGVTAKPFTGYSTEVKRDGTFKFYLVIAKGYHEDQLVVRADGEELVKNKGGYALYHITKNICISVEGIVRDTFSLALPPKVEAWKVASMKEAAKDSLYAETTLLLQAVAPEGQRFLKWTDGSTENPRLASALDAKQLYPLFTTLSETPTAKLNLVQTAGAGILGSTSNLDVVNLGEQASVKVVVLPAYSQSEVRLLANGEQVEPNMRLRAASESKTYYYQVPVAQAEVELKVEGLRLNQYQLTVVESTGGRVEGVPTAKVTHGDAVTLTAKPAEGMTFVRWWDGNTRNPYPYTVTGDQAIRAYFVGENSPVDNESVTAEEVRVCSPTTGGLWVELPVPQDIWLWDSSGRLLLHRFDSGTVRLAVPAGIYLLQCGMQPAFKVVVRH